MFKKKLGRFLNTYHNIIRFYSNNCQIFSNQVDRNTKIGKYTVIGENSHTSRDTDIGKYTYIGKYCSITRTNIGSYTSIANCVNIGVGEHDLNRFSTSSHFYQSKYNDLTKEDCTIGNDVWIGVGVTILRGVRIGDGAVVGASALINKDIPPYAIVVGVPGRIVGYRFDENRISELLAEKWWLRDKEVVEYSI